MSSAEGPWGLTTSEFWTDPWRTRSDLSWQRMLDRAEGLLVDAPPRVDLGLRQTLPLLMMAHGPLLTLLTHPLRGSAIVVVVDPEADVHRLALVPARDNVEPPELDGVSPSSRSSDHHAFELREGVRLRWRPAHVLVTVLLRDWTSNRVSVQLAHGPEVYRDPEVERFLAARTGQVGPRAASAPGGPHQLRFGPTPKSPPLVEPGLALTLERVVVGDPGAQSFAHLSLRLPLRPEQMVREPDRESERPILAVVELTIVALGSDRPNPTWLTMRVPIDELEEGEPGDEAIGSAHLSLDLLSLGSLAQDHQTWFIHVFAGVEAIGPFPFAVVAPERLADRHL